MSLKTRIMDALKPLGIHVSYDDADNDSLDLPRINFNLISNVDYYLSDKKHSQHLTYQVDVLSLNPLDVEDDLLLRKVQESLENAHLRTTSWYEVSNVSEFGSRSYDGKHANYVYFIEVR